MTQAELSLRMRDIMYVTCTPMQYLGTYFNFSPHISYSLWHLILLGSDKELGVITPETQC